jgi:A/G-specific adenine glycosylase
MAPGSRQSFRKRAGTPLQPRSKITHVFGKKLCQWFSENQRPLPWRLNPTPYRVWISEIMLQQTQAKTVIPYYNRFLRHFPNISSLALASEETILTLWSGLGYYNRARNLLRAARQIIEFHDGIFPEDYKTILSLPGIGRYTAGAICSIALHQPQPIVEGNIRRVITRLNGIRKFIPEKFFWDQMSAWIPEKDSSVFNQAIMELGATICLPAQPLCSQCPVRTFCLAKRKNLQNTIPLPRPRKPTNNIEILILVLKHKSKILLIRQKDSFIPGRWGLPYGRVSQKRPLMKAAARLIEKLSGGALSIEYRSAVRHAITHRRILAHIFTGETEQAASQFHMDAGGAQWADRAQLSRLLTSSLFKKALECCPGNNFT